jgi:hypothetical protein
VLEGGCLAEQAGAERRRRRRAEPQSREPRSPRQLVDQDLRAERGPRVAGAGRDHEPKRCKRAAGGGGDIRGGDEGAEPSECEAERDRAGVRSASRRRRPRDSGDAEDDAGATEQLARPDALVEHSSREDEEEDDPEREDRLDERQRGERQGQELQRPARDRESDRAEPQPPRGEPREERDPDGSEDLDASGFERLQRVRDLEAG